jgi:hypothetical protein
MIRRVEKYRLSQILFLICALSVASAYSQEVPSIEENIDYLVTFGSSATPNWGDDDHVQTHFISIPITQKKAIYIRVFDPDCAGQHDQINGAFNTKTKFSIYGGNGCYSNKDARNINPIGNFKSGALLISKTFSSEPQYDNNWYTFGPINPQEGEIDTELNSYVFKIIVEGLTGDDGNMYRYYLSTEESKNTAVEGGNFFAYEITFRLKPLIAQMAHLYPFIDKNVKSIKQHNFDFDKDGYIRMTSVSKKSQEMETSGDGEWSSSIKNISQSEINTSIDLHFIKASDWANDMTFYITNQYNQAIPFFSTPIGGVPRYKYKIDIKYQSK